MYINQINVDYKNNEKQLNVRACAKYNKSQMLI